MRVRLPVITLATLLLAGCTMAPLISSPTPLPPGEPSGEAPSPTSMSSMVGDEVWTLRDVKAGALDAGAVRAAIGDASITLADADTATGTAGCRTFEATYELVNSRTLRVTGLTVDESRCTAATPRLDQFVDFVTSAPISAQLSGDLLTLSSHEGAYAMVFESSSR